MGNSSELANSTKADSRKKLKGLRARFAQTSQPEVALPEVRSLSLRQRRALPFAVIAALIAGSLLVGKYFAVIVLAFLAAVIFYPVYKSLSKRIANHGLAAQLTFGITLLCVIIPLVITIALTVGQLNQIFADLTEASKNLSLSDTAKHLLASLNDMLMKVSHGTLEISAQDVQTAFTQFISGLANAVLNLLTSSFSGISSLVTEFILFWYIFVAMLVHASSLKRMLRALNPLGDAVSEVYLTRTAQMARGVVGGQFVIAFCQGFTEAAVLWLAGVNYFFFFALVLTFLSIIPLGGGILAIPIGIILILMGHVPEGLFILVMHFTVIVNIDNVLRPRLVPKSVRLNPALMMLAVFGGIGLFGFLGIAIGPILMIIVLTTLQMYLPLAEGRNAKTVAETAIT